MKQVLCPIDGKPMSQYGYDKTVYRFSKCGHIVTVKEK